MLGAPYEQRLIDLGRDDEGPVVATLIRRLAEPAGGPDSTPAATAPDSSAGRGRRAVLYVHGWADYFFQTHLADFYTGLGWDFYAIDLRKHGRSLLGHQTPNYCGRIDEYFPELDEASRIIRADHDVLLINAHSTGGLTTALWAHERRADGVLDGLFLNSPFFDFNLRWLLRRPGVAAAGRLRPRRLIRIGSWPAYGQSLHSDYNGEWTYDLTWKPLGGFPVYAGWLRAIREGHQRLRAGLDIQVPVLVASSDASLRLRAWSQAAMAADLVLDVDHIARWAPALGRHVTLVRIAGGLHDLALSAPAVRQQLFSEVERWLGAYVAGARPDRRPPMPRRGAPADVA